mmetsp:Transcript_87992/g.284875  ORF Transcript_87992/g.284875 Transcript_87992/m.284875 type:complete len:285 (+) Transcript_87992:48-902(+)
MRVALVLGLLLAWVQGACSLRRSQQARSGLGESGAASAAARLEAVRSQLPAAPEAAPGGEERPPHRVVINVGLVRTGTRSFVQALRSSGLRAAHVGPCNEPYDLEDGRNAVRRFLEANDGVADIPFNGLHFIQAAAEYAQRHPERVTLVATVQDRERWIRSMDHQDLGGCWFRRSYGIPCLPHLWTPAELGAAWDRHMEVLKEHNITMLPVGRWAPLCRVLGSLNSTASAACERAAVLSTDGYIPHHRFDPPRDEFSGWCDDRTFGSGFLQLSAETASDAPFQH